MRPKLPLALPRLDENVPKEVTAYGALGFSSAFTSSPYLGRGLKMHRDAKEALLWALKFVVIHGIEVVPSPSLTGLDEGDGRCWMELTGREVSFSIPPEASDFGSWRNLLITDFELERVPQLIKCASNSQSKKLLNGSGLNLPTQPTNSSSKGDDDMDLSPVSSKRRNDFFSNGGDEDPFCANPPLERNVDMELLHLWEPQWLNEFSRVMKNVYGPVTAAKTKYKDDEGYLIIITLSYVVSEVSRRNTPTRGIIKVSGMIIFRTPSIRKNDKTFKLTDPSPEYCHSGDFVREIPLSTRIPEDANIEAYYDGLDRCLR
ncbi:hypothetical protein MLD38_029903 [Melastoma candidum]|uniref:Uncharacterized protein n=1 Tax=Melastoma candidum TaxID=119954 RepID=A0ACB9MK87_9MYRT|nr:hypothetical protein MLD38_029903 [Melastoma candidum]